MIRQTSVLAIFSVLIFLFGTATGTKAASPEFAFKATFKIKPYLFTVLGQQIGIGWQYNEEIARFVTTDVELFDGNNLIQTIHDTTDDGFKFAILPLASCGFGKNIGYRVTGQIQITRIAEIPCGDSAEPVRFSFMADTQEGPKFDRVFAEQVRAFPASAVLNGGDLVQTGTKYQDWVEFFDAMDPVGASRILFPSVGNHEYRNDEKAPLWKRFFRTEAKDAHYAFDLGAARVITINSGFEDDPSLRSSQLEWLRQQLALPAKWKIVFFHHPPYSVGFFNNPRAPRKEFVTLQDYYVPLFEEYKVDLVLNGHVHLFETAEKNGVHYLIVGPAGGKMGVYGNKDPYMKKTARERSVVHLEAAPDHLRALSMSIDGTVLDDLILRK